MTAHEDRMRDVRKQLAGHPALREVEKLYETLVIMEASATFWHGRAVAAEQQE